MLQAERNTKRELLLLVLAGLVVALIMAYVMSLLPDGLPLRWLAAALPVGVWHAWYAWRRLEDNRPNSDAPIYPTFGHANGMSLGRGLLNAMLAGFIVVQIPVAFIWLPTALWTTSGFLDMFDGVVARVTKRPSLLGETLDMEFDSAAMLIVIVLTVVDSLMPVWYIALALARYAFIFGLYLRKRRGLPIADLTESVQRRIGAGIHMAFLTVILWPIVPKPYTTVAAYAFGMPFAALFLRDWLVASCVIDPLDARYLRMRQAVRATLYKALPLLGRVMLAALLLSGTMKFDIGSPLGWVTVVTSLMVIVGLISRLGAILLLIPLVYGDAPLAWQLAMLVPTIATIQFGGGPFCLWLPEERLLERRLGGEE